MGVEGGLAVFMVRWSVLPEDRARGGSLLELRVECVKCALS